MLSNFKEAIFINSSPIVDYEDEVNLNWVINDIIQMTDYRGLSIRKEDILDLRFDTLFDFLFRLSITKETLISAISSVDIFFPDYNNDSREIFQIPEIMRWLELSINEGIPWFYFLNIRHKNTGLKLLVHAYCKHTYIKQQENEFFVKYDSDDLVQFVEKNFINLNKFTYDKNIDNEINVEISKNIVSYFERMLLSSNQ